jgi:hypothetical protein
MLKNKIELLFYNFNMAEERYICSNFECENMPTEPTRCDNCAAAYCSYRCLVDNRKSHTQICEQRRLTYSSSDARKTEQEKFLRILENNNDIILRVWNKKNTTASGAIFIETKCKFSEIVPEVNAVISYAAGHSAKEFYNQKTQHKNDFGQFDKLLTKTGFFPVVLITTDRIFHGVLSILKVNPDIPNADMYSVLLK